MLKQLLNLWEWWWRITPFHSGKSCIKNRVVWNETSDACVLVTNTRPLTLAAHMMRKVGVPSQPVISIHFYPKSKAKFVFCYILSAICVKVGENSSGTCYLAVPHIFVSHCNDQYWSIGKCPRIRSVLSLAQPAVLMKFEIAFWQSPPAWNEFSLTGGMLRSTSSSRSRPFSSPCTNTRIQCTYSTTTTCPGTVESRYNFKTSMQRTNSNSPNFCPPMLFLNPNITIFWYNKKIRSQVMRYIEVILYRFHLSPSTAFHIFCMELSSWCISWN